MLRSLRSRLLALGLAQVVVLVVVSLVIAFFTMPRHPAPLAEGAGAPVPPPPVGPLLTLAAAVVVLGVGSALTARWIVRPLLAIRRTADELAAARFSARTGVARDDEIGDVALALDGMSERVEGMLRKERELLANVSHELRTPLARVRVAMGIATEGDAATMRAALADVSDDLGELEQMLDDILVAARLDAADRRGEAGLPMGSTELVDPMELAAEAVARLGRRHPTRPVSLEIEGSLADVRVDARLFRRVLDNLLDNAHKYSPDPDARVLLRARADEGRVDFEVVDHGTGIAPADVPRVFEPFFRAERSRTRAAGGVGLGLTLVRRIVEAHGGSVSAESELGRGTTMRVRLPAFGAGMPGRSLPPPRAHG